MKKFLFYTVLSVVLSINLSGCKQGLKSPELTQSTESIQAGKDYQILLDSEITPTVDPQTQVKIHYFLKYHDINCYKLQDALQHWLSKHSQNVHVEYLPISAQVSYLLRLHYTLSMIKEDAVSLIFKFIHQDNETLTNDSNEALLKKNQVDIQHYQTAKAFQAGIDHQIARGLRLEETYQINHLPSIVVAGRYRIGINAIEDERDLIRFFKILDFLVAKVQKGEF